LIECLGENKEADLFILIDYGAAPFETIIKELEVDNPTEISHLILTRTQSRKLRNKLDINLAETSQTVPLDVLQENLGLSNLEFIQDLVRAKKHVVLIDDIEHEGITFDVLEVMIRSLNRDCKIVKFPVIKSQQIIKPDEDQWSFALLDDLGLTKGLKMPWEDKQSEFIGRVADSKISMKSVPKENPSPLAEALKKDLKSVTNYIKNDFSV
jgi:hypothetical protein